MHPYLLKFPVRIFIAATGAGAGAQDQLWQTPGISTVFAGAAFPYAKEELTRFIGYEPEKFVSVEVAADMAIASYLRAARCCDAGQIPVGVGMTCSVTSNTPHRGSHRVIGVSVSRHGAFLIKLELDKGIDPTWRASDGVVADRTLMELTYAASQPPLVSHRREASDSSLIQALLGREDGSAAVRAALMKRPWFTRAGQRWPLPPSGAGLTILPGAFNPVHEGHFANATSETILQITATTPHKPQLSVPEMLDRVAKILPQRDALLLEEGGMYIAKARRFPGAVLRLGTDAAARILDLKWYLDPQWGTSIPQVLQEFRDLGTKFEVSVRFGDSFAKLMESVPAEFRDLFTELPMTEFSALSSTQIRQLA